MNLVSPIVPVVFAHWWFPVSISPYMLINWNTVRAAPSPSFILFNYQHRLIDTYSVCYNLALGLFCSNCSTFCHWELFCLSFCHLTCPILYNLVLQTKCSWLIYFFCLSSGINHFSKKPWFLLLESGSETSICVYCHWGVIAPRLSLAKSLCHGWIFLLFFCIYWGDFFLCYCNMLNYIEYFQTLTQPCLFCDFSQISGRLYS